MAKYLEENKHDFSSGNFSLHPLLQLHLDGRPVREYPWQLPNF